jgi:hypothetical protein
MKFKSAVYSQASGSIGGQTFSHNKGGMYVRSRGLVKQTNTPAQQAVKSALSSLTSAWNDVLEGGDRASWVAYAKNTPMLNTLGDSRQVSGLNMFLRYNVPNIQTGGAMLQAGPSINNLGAFTPPTGLTAAAPDTSFHLTANLGDPWTEVPGSNLLVFISRAQNATITYFKGPFQFAGKVPASAVTSAITLVNPYGLEFVAGSQYFVRTEVAYGDGRLTSDAIQPFIAT